MTLEGVSSKSLSWALAGGTSSDEPARGSAGAVSPDPEPEPPTPTPIPCSEVSSANSVTSESLAAWSAAPGGMECSPWRARAQPDVGVARPLDVVGDQADVGVARPLALGRHADDHRAGARPGGLGHLEVVQQQVVLGSRTRDAPAHPGGGGAEVGLPEAELELPRGRSRIHRCPAWSGPGRTSATRGRCRGRAGGPARRRRRRGTATIRRPGRRGPRDVALWP